MIPRPSYVVVVSLVLAASVPLHAGDRGWAGSGALTPAGTPLDFRVAFDGDNRDFGADPPDLSIAAGREHVVVVTNDGWFGESSAPFQHLRMGVVRAVENRRYMVRTANTGISAIIDPYGRIESRTSIGVRTILDGTAHFRSDLTFYTQYGDLFAYANVLAAGLLVTAAAKETYHVRGTHRKIRPTQNT